MRLLLVEDDARLAAAVRSWMGHSGVDVDWITGGLEIESCLASQHFDWLVLDLGLPDIDGEAALRSLRAAGFELPVIVITAREQVQDRVRLLDLGADDFLVKPVHLDELAARLRAVQRRRSGAPAGTDGGLRHGALCVYPATATVALDGSFVPVTRREFWLLEALVRHKDRVLSREELADGLGGADDLAGNNVDVHVHHLRRKLGACLIRTVRGQGYTLGPPH